VNLRLLRNNTLPSLFFNSRGSKHFNGQTSNAFNTPANSKPVKLFGASPAVQTVVANVDFLEASPYYDMSSIPINTFKHKEPLLGKVVEVKSLFDDANSIGEIFQVIIDHGKKMLYWEGQSLGIIPPGLNSKTGKPNGARLYSIASTRYGDDMRGSSVSLCIRKAVFTDPETGFEVAEKKGFMLELSLGIQTRGFDSNYWAVWETTAYARRNS